MDLFGILHKVSRLKFSINFSMMYLLTIRKAQKSLKKGYMEMTENFYLETL